MAKRSMTLRGSQEAFKTIVDTSLEGIYQVDNSGKFIFVNESFASLFGYRQEELSGKHFADMISAETLPKVEKMVQEVLSGKNVRDEVAVKHKDGHEIPVRFSATPLRERGKVVGLTGVLSDITERKQAEEALRESEAKWRSLVENAPETILTLDRDGTILFINRTLPDTTPEEMTGTSIYSHIRADRQKRIRKVIESVFQSGESQKYEADVASRDGTLLWFENSVAPIWSGDQVVSVIYVSVDITERKHAEDALREAHDELEKRVKERTLELEKANEALKFEMGEHRRAEEAAKRITREFLTILENSVDMIYRLNLQSGTYDYLSPSSEIVLGYTPEEFIASGFENASTLVHPDDLEMLSQNILELIERAPEQTATGPIEYRMNHKQLGYRWVSDNRSIIYDDRNMPVAAIGILRDVTERKQAEQALQESERNYRVLFDSQIDGAAVVDAEMMKIVLVNETALKMYGFDSLEEALEVNLIDYIHPDDRDRILRIITEDMFEKDLRQVVEFRIITKDGRERWASAVGTRIEYQGKMAGLASFRDITEQKQAEEALLESEEKGRALLNAPPDSAILIDRAGIILDLNRVAADRFGKTVDELIGVNIYDIVPPDVAKGRRAQARKVISSGMPARFEDERAGIIFDSTYYPIFDARGKVTRIAIFARDITERKQAAEALRQSEERYRVIVENIRDVIWTTDKDLRYTYLSPTIMRQRGYSVEEAMALGPEDILTPASLEVVLKAFTPDAAADNGERNKLIKPRPLELEVYCKNGSTIWTETEVAYIRDSDGQIIGTIGTTRDITERKQAEEKLRMSEHKFKDLIETTPDWVWEIDENGVYTYVSPNIEQLLGYEVNEVLGKTPFDLMPREEAKKIGKTFKEIVIKRDPIHRLGNINRHRDGHLVVLETNGIPFYDEEGVFKGYRGIDRDITERKRAEEALREKEEHFRALIENSLEAIAIIDGEGAIQYLGPSFERLMGYDLEEYLGKNPFDHVHTDDRSRVAAIFAELMQKPGAIVQEEIRVLHKNGSLRTVEVVGQNLLHNPAVGGLVANIRDITERKQAAEKLQALYQQEKDLREQIEKEMKRRVEFTRVLAHELKTPLTSVLASSDLLISEVRDEPLLSLAKNIRQGASNLNSRIDELLDLARGEVGMLQLKREPVDLSHLLREAADSMTPLALGRGQSIILRLPPALPTVQADTTRLQQIVTNLLNNAVKFTPKGGSIILRARKKDASVIVEVQDTGRGIPKREQERLFEPYQRLEEAEENLSGLGLGLSLCKTLVELHGGQIWMRSHVGRGSTFGFSLPLEAADKQATEPEKIAKLWKVLIIEDDQQIVDSVSLTFRLRWPEVQLISTGLGEEGIEMAETEAPDIVILDLGLPDISGFDALRQIRLFSSVPVVILTVREDESDMVKGLEWGADDYLVKPFKQLELLARLKVQLRKQTPPDEEAPIVCGPLRLEPSTFQLTHDGKEISLTIIEGRILECLMRNAGHIVTHSRLAETVWGEDYPRALDSLRVYIRYLREKIEANPSKPKIILTKAGVGYSLAKPV